MAVFTGLCTLSVLRQWRGGKWNLQSKCYENLKRKQLESIQQINPDAVTIIEHEDLLKCPGLGIYHKSFMVSEI